MDHIYQQDWQHHLKARHRQTRLEASFYLDHIYQQDRQHHSTCSIFIPRRVAEALYRAYIHTNKTGSIILLGLHVQSRLASSFYRENICLQDWNHYSTRTLFIATWLTAALYRDHIDTKMTSTSIPQSPYWHQKDWQHHSTAPYSHNKDGQ